MNEPTVDTSGHDLDLSRYAIPVYEASSLFAQAGVPRSPRTVTRYCLLGHLDCRKFDTETSEKYLISEDSIERRIHELQQAVVSSHGAPSPDMTGHDQPRPGGGVGLDEAREENEQLMKEILDLKITNQAKGQMLEMMREERSALLTAVEEKSYRIGALETEVKQLAPPANNGERPDFDDGSEGSGEAILHSKVEEQSASYPERSLGREESEVIE